NSRDLFIYNSKLAADALVLQANIQAAQAAGRQVVDLGSGVLDPVWQAVDVPFLAQTGASPAAMQTGTLVGDILDPRYLTLKLTRSLAVHAERGVVSAYSETTVGLDAPQGDMR